MPSAESSISLSVPSSDSSPATPPSIVPIAPSSSSRFKAFVAAVISALFTKLIPWNVSPIFKSTSTVVLMPVAKSPTKKVLPIQSGSTLVIPTGGVSVISISVASRVP